nr:hypothetical protein [Tanacetum cinerariifolium]
MEWPIYSLKDDGYYDGGDLAGIIRNENMVYFQNYECYEELDDSKLKDEALKENAKFEESQDPCLSDVEWEDFEHANHIGSDAKYNTYLDISRIFNIRARKEKEETIKDEKGSVTYTITWSQTMHLTMLIRKRSNTKKEDISNHSTMDWYMKNALWMYWISGDDEEVLTSEKLSDLEEIYMYEEDESAKIFRIETDIFDYKTPLCKAFNKFNYFLNVDIDLLTRDICRFKTYEEYKNAWIHEMNKDMTWVPEEPWSENGVPYEIIDHYCVPFRFKTEEYVAIKECGYDDWTRIEEDACHAYQDIFTKMDEGWFVTRAE